MRQEPNEAGNVGGKNIGGQEPTTGTDSQKGRVLKNHDMNQNQSKRRGYVRSAVSEVYDDDADVNGDGW